MLSNIHIGCFYQYKRLTPTNTCKNLVVCSLAHVGGNDKGQPEVITAPAGVKALTSLFIESGEVCILNAIAHGILVHHPKVATQPTLGGHH